MRKNLIVIALAGLGLSACSMSTIQRDLGYVVQGSTIVQMACKDVLPLATMAGVLPTVGPFVAAGVTALCASDASILKAASDPSTSEWLGQQGEIMRAALTRAGFIKA